MTFWPTRMFATVAMTTLAIACGAAPPPPRQTASPVAAQPALRSSAPIAPQPMVFFDDGVEEVFLDPERVAKIRARFPAVDQTVARAQRDLKLPGLAVGIIVDGELAHVATAGHADLARQAPVTADTIFRVGSVTKTLTAAAIMKLRDEGKLSLDDPAAKYVPELHGVRHPTRDSAKMTVRHLLTHQSGLPTEAREELTAASQPFTRQRLAAELKDLPLTFAPGTRWQYSNLGFVVLGQIIERVSKLSYRVFLARNLFEPLGMKSAGWERSELRAENVALSYELKKADPAAPVAEEQFGIRDASGGLYLSVKDLARWVGFNLSAYPARDDADAGVLSRATLREMHGANGKLYVRVTRPFIKPDSWSGEAWAGSSALGWDASGLCDFERLIEKGGFVKSYQTFTGFFPSEGLGIVVMANTGFHNDLKQRALFDVLRVLEESEALKPRVRKGKATPALERAMAHLLQMMDSWDEEEHSAMRTEALARHTPIEVGKSELAGYRALHGRCGGPELVSFDSAGQGRYRMTCERGRFEMAIWLVGDLLNGFMGYSSDVSAAPETVRRARAELDKKNRQPLHRQRRGLCRLGALRERDGARWHRFSLDCERGPQSILSLRVSAGDPGKLETFEIGDDSSVKCGRLADGSK